MARKEINDRFDFQIQREKRGLDYDEKSKSYYSKEIFNLTLDFTIDDWRNMRDEKYWLTIDSIEKETYSETELMKLKYRLECIEDYLVDKKEKNN